MAVAGIDYTISDKTKVSFESAISKNDINLFSKNDKTNDNGYAFRFQLDDKRKIGNDTLSGWSLISQLQAEYTDINFNPIENYRATEFTRDWNTNTIASPSVKFFYFQILDCYIKWISNLPTDLNTIIETRNMKD